MNKINIIKLLHFHIICDIMLMFDSKMMKSRVTCSSVFISGYFKPLKQMSGNK
jgi:hypothetical protein